MKKKNLLVAGGVLSVGALALGAGFMVGNEISTNANANEVIQPETIVEITHYGEASEWDDLLDIGFFFRDSDTVARELEAETGITPILEEAERGYTWILEEEDGSVTAFITEEVYYDIDGNIIE